MKLSKAIKRIVALGTGVTMVGATILGAMAAADLSKYPSPFVDQGAFNALIVIGAKAKTEDVLGAIDIATSLQYSTKVTKTVPGSTSGAASVSGEGIKIETSNNKLTIGETLVSVKTKIDERDLPVLLAKGTYVNDGDDASTAYEYTQQLAFDNATVEFYDPDNDNTPRLMLYTPRAAGTRYFMRYTLDFTKEPESDYASTAASSNCGAVAQLCDFEGSKLVMQGIDYEVTKAEILGKALTWEMMGGVSLNTMYEGETKTFTVNGKDYEVTVDIISDTGESVVLSVNGQSTKELTKDQTDKVAGIELGIKKVMSNEAGESGAGRDLVQFYLGANKLVLSDTDVTAALDTNVKIGSETNDDLFVDWTLTNTSVKVTLDKLQLTWAPQDQLPIDEATPVTFPLGTYKVEFAGMTHGTEEKIVFKNSGNNILEINAPLEGGETSFDALYSGGTTFTSFGKSSTAGDGKLVLIEGGAWTVGDYTLLSDTSAFESHLVKLDSISAANLTKIKDMATGSVYEQTCTTIPCTINIGNTALVLSTISSAASPRTAVINETSEVGDQFYTKEGLTVDLNVNATTGHPLVDSADVEKQITLTEESATGTVAGGNVFYLNASVTSSKVEVKRVLNSNAFDILAGKTFQGYEKDTDDYYYYTTFGTQVVHKTGGTQDYVEVAYPGEEAHANVFVNSLAAQVVSGSSGTTYQEVQKIDVGAAVLDTEIASLTAQNTIVVGGPCVNSLAAELMGNPSDCTAGFEEGKATIKLFEHTNGKVALLVAGYSAMDTRRASRVVAKYDTYKEFKGTELEVTGTSLSDIKVGVPTPKVVETPAATE